MLQKYQFSCFLPDYFRPETLKHDWGSIHWKESKYAAFGVYRGYVRDPVDGANHYLASWMLEGPNKLPAWAKNQKPVAEIGQHLFYRL
jgi:spore germination cell wall hydrolase CwlJ-like protein